MDILLLVAILVGIAALIAGAWLVFKWQHPHVDDRFGIYNAYWPNGKRVKGTQSANPSSTWAKLRVKIGSTRTNRELKDEGFSVREGR